MRDQIQAKERAKAGAKAKVPLCFNLLRNESRLDTYLGAQSCKVPVPTLIGRVALDERQLTLQANLNSNKWRSSSISYSVDGYCTTNWYINQLKAGVHG